MIAKPFERFTQLVACLRIVWIELQPAAVHFCCDQVIALLRVVVTQAKEMCRDFCRVERRRNDHAMLRLVACIGNGGKHPDSDADKHRCQQQWPISWLHRRVSPSYPPARCAS